MVFDGPVAISPDGTLGAGAVARNGKRSLRVIDWKSGREREIAGTEGADLPFWSPDGSAVAFFADGRLNTLELANGKVTLLGAAPDPKGGTWSREGAIVYAGTGNGPLYRVPAGGGTAAPVTTLDESAGETGHAWPQFLPDGRLLYSASLRGADEAEIFVTTTDGRERQHVLRAPGRAVFTPAAGGLLVYCKGGKLLAVHLEPGHPEVRDEPRLLAPFVGYSYRHGVRLFSAGPSAVVYQAGDPDRARRLVWFDRDGIPIQPIGEPARYSLPQVSPDGKNILVARADAAGKSDIWLMDAVTGVSRRLTTEKYRGSHALWSADGAAFIYASWRTQRVTIARADLNAADGRTETIYEIDKSVFPTDWSRHGALLLFEAVELKLHGVWGISTNGIGQPFEVAKFENASAFSGKLSPDGKWVAFEYESQPGAIEVYLAPFRGSGGAVLAIGDCLRVSSGGGFDVQWGPDGRELFYITNDRRLVAAPFAGGAGAGAGTPKTLFSVAGSESNPLSYQPGFGYSLSPDSRRFLFNLGTGEADRELTVVRLDAAIDGSLRRP